MLEFLVILVVCFREESLLKANGDTVTASKSRFFSVLLFRNKIKRERESKRNWMKIIIGSMTSEPEKTNYETGYSVYECAWKL